MLNSNNLGINAKKQHQSVDRQRPFRGAMLVSIRFVSLAISNLVAFELLKFLTITE